METDNKLRLTPKQRRDFEEDLHELHPYSLENPCLFPIWAKHRDSTWTYVSWIKNPPDPLCCCTFDYLVERARRSDHGERREVDIYPQGATCFFQENKSTLDGLGEHCIHVAKQRKE